MGFAKLLDVLCKDAGFGLEVFDRKKLDPLLWWALDKSNKWHQRQCTLTAPLTFWGVVSLSLYRSQSIVGCFGQVFEAARGFEDVPRASVTDEAIYHARERLGCEPLRLFSQCLARRSDPQPTVFGLIPCAADGIHMDVPDTPANEAEFGRQSASRGQTAFPQMGGVGLIYTDTRQFVDMIWGRHSISELAAARELIKHLDKRHILFLDRRYTEVGLWFDILDRGIRLVHRLSASFKPKCTQQIGDGDWLIEVGRNVEIPLAERVKSPGRGGVRKWRWESRTMRLIKYSVGNGEVVSLLTDLLDPAEYPALEIALSYHLRWEIELANDELKTHLSTVQHGTCHTTFRSQTPAGIYQEAWSLLVAYQLIRGLMVEAGTTRSVPPLDISFVGALEVIRSAIPKLQWCPTRLRPRLYRRLLLDIAAKKNPRPRRKRANDRVIKRKMSNWPVKHPQEHRSRRYDFAANLKLAID